MSILISKSSRSCGEESPYKILLLPYIIVLYLYKLTRWNQGYNLKVRHTLYFREVQTGYARHSFWPQLLAILNPKSSSGCGTVYRIWQPPGKRVCGKLPNPGTAILAFRIFAEAFVPYRDVRTFRLRPCSTYGVDVRFASVESSLVLPYILSYNY